MLINKTLTVEELLKILIEFKFASNTDSISLAQLIDFIQDKYTVKGDQ